MKLLSMLVLLGTMAAAARAETFRFDGDAGSPPLFEASVPEGAYRVTITLRGAAGGSEVTVKAEARRAVLGRVVVPEGGRVEKSFAVWRMSDKLAGGGAVRLTGREVGTATYDDVLSLEFNGTRPVVDSVKIEPAADVTSVFLAGDSTVTDQIGEPWSAWGQMLPMYFDDDVAVANLASSGRTLRSFRAERRLNKLMSLLKPGDYVLIQFAHNDQKETGEGIGAFESYASDLADYVEMVRAAGGRPILVTPTVRRRFEGGAWYDTLGDYPEAVRGVAKKKGVPLVDLHDASRRIVEALGEGPSKAMYVHYPADTFPGQVEPLRDDTHFNAYGGDLLARAVIAGLRSAAPELAAHLRDPATTIDPDHPEPPEQWHWPASPAKRVSEKPAGD